MKIIGIICEYNPFHRGHKKQIDLIRQVFGADCAIVCLMSGNFVQRGEPAIFDKSERAKAAIACGADLVLELPVTYALSSAEGFARGGVQILSGFCDILCFGTENGTVETLTATAQALLKPEFHELLRNQLESGCSFPTARQRALEVMGVDNSLLQNPNDILAVEYCKAILLQNTSMEIYPIRRDGNYHDTLPDIKNPSATSLRSFLFENRDISDYVPEDAFSIFTLAAIHSLRAGERGVLSKLRTMSDDEFSALPYGSEGLWRKFMHACRQEATVEEILAATKSKRYTRTRLNRMLMCAYLGITQEILDIPAPYTRVLALRNSGRQVLNAARKIGEFPHIGEVIHDPYQLLEQRCDTLYSLFRHDTPGIPNPKRRVCILPER